jgi:serine/threonine-protein kinase RsbW
VSAPSHDAITLSVPARAGSLHVVRTVVGTAAAHSQLTIDEIDDLRLAVEEAAAQLLEVGGETLSLRIQRIEDGLEVIVWVDAGAVSWPPEGMERTLAYQILKGLSDTVAWDQSPAGPAVRVVKRSDVVRS